jgi:hypothetical protein
VDAGIPVSHASVPQLDSTGHSWTPETSTQIRLDVCDLRKCQPERPAPPIAAPGQAVLDTRPHEPLTKADLAHHWPIATRNGLPDRPRTRRRPGLGEYPDRA